MNSHIRIILYDSLSHMKAQALINLSMNIENKLDLELNKFLLTYNSMESNQE